MGANLSSSASAVKISLWLMKEALFDFWQKKSLSPFLSTLSLLLFFLFFFLINHSFLIYINIYTYFKAPPLPHLLPTISQIPNPPHNNIVIIPSITHNHPSNFLASFCKEFFLVGHGFFFSFLFLKNCFYFLFCHVGC